MDGFAKGAATSVCIHNTIMFAAGSRVFSTLLRKRQTPKPGTRPACDDLSDIAPATSISKLAGDPGFEPGIPDPESGVLPLD